MNNELRKEMILNAGLSPHLPQDDASINDKANADPKGLAERIVEKDFTAINSSDVLLFDVLETTGTTTEIGYVFGQKETAKNLKEYVHELQRDGETSHSVLCMLLDRLDDIIDKPVVMTSSDVRRANPNPQSGDRREWSINQLLYGVVLALTNGKGFTEEEDLFDVLLDFS